MKHKIVCQITGVQLAILELDGDALASCSSLAWHTEFKGLVLEHPLFSLSKNNLLRTARIAFRELAKTGHKELSPAAEITARVAFVAVLKSMGVMLRREGHNNLPYILPHVFTVLAHGQHLLELAYWYANLQSVRFKFPHINIAKINTNTELGDIGAYLSVCTTEKNRYLEEVGNRLRDAMLDDNLEIAANRAEAAVRSSHTKRVPKTSLWNWFIAAIGSEDAKALERLKVDPNELPFFNKMFFASDAALKAFSIDDVDAMEDLLMRYAPLGTTPFYGMRTELQRMKAVIQKSTKSFTVDWTTLMVGNSGIKAPAYAVDAAGNRKLTEDERAIEQLANSPAPTRDQFSSNVDYIRAKAKWDVAQFKTTATADSEARKQIF